MTKSFLRLVTLAFLGTCLVPLVTVVNARQMAGLPYRARFLLALGAAVLAVLLMTATVHVLLRKLDSRVDADAREQEGFLNALAPRYVDLAIVGAAALSLFLELAVIRWQGTVFEFFAFYKNFSLLCCFAGLGLGYALANRERIYLGLTIPLLTWQFLLMIGLRFGMPEWSLESLRALPFSEQLNMGIQGASVKIYSFLSVTFLLTVLTFIPVGQLCGRLMRRRGKLKAYGLNLLGSLIGVILMFVLGWLWTPPPVWFAVGFLGTLLFCSRKPASLLLGIGITVTALVVLSWPVSPLAKSIYSPYQHLELFQGPRGLMVIRAAGHYYQKVLDLGRSNQNVELDPELKYARNYYELPYRIYGSAHDVAIMGSGTGNDVAAALRSGVEHVDAIEIDPAILMAGVVNHPERPYEDRRVRASVNDARSFMRATNRVYDMVIYGLLDSHTLLSHASSVRLDSFVYTVQGLREARAHLKPGGVLSLSFTVLNDELGRKIYLMMEQAFDGRPPVVVEAGYDGAVIFLQAKDRNLVLPAHLLEEAEFKERTAFYANPALHADVSTDDWPFFYMPRRIYPLSYLIMVGLMLVLSFFVTANFFPERPEFGHLPFFLLGAGFMLVETKGITELGLTFGNSWQVIGIVISGILVMAFLANCVVQWFQVRQPLFPYLLLLASLSLGWWVSSGGFLPAPMGRLQTVAVLTSPIFFSGMVFSTLLQSHEGISGIMAVNLLGAMCGGLLEYNSMYFGFRALYLIAMMLYGLAFFSQVVSARANLAKGREAELRSIREIGRGTATLE